MNKNQSKLIKTKNFIITFPLVKGENLNYQVEEYLESTGFVFNGQGLGSMEFEGRGDMAEIDKALQAKFGKNLVYDFILD